MGYFCNVMRIPGRSRSLGVQRAGEDFQQALLFWT